MKRYPYLLILFFLTFTAMADPRLVVLDVGEGQALLIQSKDHGILIDTGHPGMARHVLDRLDDLGVKHLDYLILTHLHPDHAGGYFRLREAWPDTPVLYNGQPLPDDVSPDLTRWVHDALKEDPRRRILAAGDTLQWQEFGLDVLWPEKFVNRDINEHSLVLLLRHGSLQLLIMGDTNQKVEQALLQMNRLPENIDILVVGHHGAADASGKAFIDRLRPKLAIISINKNNIRGYPSADVLLRLKKAGARILRTDQEGEIRLAL